MISAIPFAVVVAVAVVVAAAVAVAVVVAAAVAVALHIADIVAVSVALVAALAVDIAVVDVTVVDAAVGDVAVVDVVAAAVVGDDHRSIATTSTTKRVKRDFFSADGEKCKLLLLLFSPKKAKLDFRWDRRFWNIAEIFWNFIKKCLSTPYSSPMSLAFDPM